MTASFTTLWIYTILKLRHKRAGDKTSFTTLWIYTILKLAEHKVPLFAGFTTLWIYTILKLFQQTVLLILSFTTLWIYTILKRPQIVHLFIFRFTTLWIYTILKHERTNKKWITVSLPYGFTLFSNCGPPMNLKTKFHYLMDLHYSQTRIALADFRTSFTTLWIYTILKPVCLN